MHHPVQSDQTRPTRRLGYLLTFLALSLLPGCSFQEALADGVFGGVSDTVAGAISMTVLRILGFEG